MFLAQLGAPLEHQPTLLTQGNLSNISPQLPGTQKKFVDAVMASQILTYPRNLGTAIFTM